MRTLPLLFVLAFACRNDKTDLIPVVVDTDLVDSDGDGVDASVDCDDTNAAVSPDAPEECDGLDNDCNGLVDDGVPLLEFYADSDADGWGGQAIQACEQPDDTVTLGGDCDDNVASVNPDAEELCDDIDNNCDGEIDEGLRLTVYTDADGDGVGDATTAMEVCQVGAGQVEVSGDCDDTLDSVFPDAAERCDAVDNDCDGAIDEDVVGIWYADADQDGFGDDDASLETCDPPPGWVPQAGDCDDLDATASPAGIEVCDDIDNDCNGDADDGLEFVTYWSDADNDGYGATISVEVCRDVPGFVPDDGDCDDADPSVSPVATEVCDAVDNDCDGNVDGSAVDAADWYADVDGDGWGDGHAIVTACEAPQDHVPTDGDCDDAEPLSHPGLDEVCDGLDNDCDGEVDEPSSLDAGTWYADSDGDGYGAAASAVHACEQPAGFTADATDCNDGEAASNPGAAEVCDGLDNDCDGGIDVGLTSVFFADGDGDGQGTAAVSTDACAAPSGFVDSAGDCDDSDATINTSADEICDGVDNDCDGSIDVGLTSMFYADADGDGEGTASLSTTACSAPAGFVSDAGDCNDGDAAVNTAATEVCDGVDNDCDGGIDVGLESLFYADADGDGQGTASLSTSACSAPTGFVSDTGDCDDGDAAVNTSAIEVCDNVDNDCDGGIDVGLTSLFYADADGDGEGTPTLTAMACQAPTGFVSDAADCDDGDAAVNPSATEVCDGIDNDCDGGIDVGLTAVFYADADADGQGTDAVTLTACVAPDGFAASDGDCDDGNGAINSAATEVCDGLDNDCDGGIDVGLTFTAWLDEDGDGFGAEEVQACTLQNGIVGNDTDCDDTDPAINEAALEVCDGIDNDCSGVADDVAACEVRPDPGCAHPDVALLAMGVGNGVTDLAFDDNCNAVLSSIVSGNDPMYVIEPSGASTVIAGFSNYNQQSVAIDPVSGDYALSHNDNSNAGIGLSVGMATVTNLVTSVYNNGSLWTNVFMNRSSPSLAWDSDGCIWAPGFAGSGTLSCVLRDGSVRDVILSGDHIESVALAPDETLYMAVGPSVYQVDKLTGAATLYHTAPDSVLDMVFDYNDDLYIEHDGGQIEFVGGDGEDSTTYATVSGQGRLAISPDGWLVRVLPAPGGPATYEEWDLDAP